MVEQGPTTLGDSLSDGFKQHHSGRLPANQGVIYTMWYIICAVCIREYIDWRMPDGIYMEVVLAPCRIPLTSSTYSWDAKLQGAAGHGCSRALCMCVCVHLCDLPSSYSCKLLVLWPLVISTHLEHSIHNTTLPLSQTSLGMPYSLAGQHTPPREVHRGGRGRRRASLGMPSTLLW